MADAFGRFARWIAGVTGSAGTFVLALLVIVVWAITGPVFGFSDTWQLVINTSTTIVTFLMVFLIQNTQNRDSTAIQVKLDELIRAVSGARNELIDLEEDSEQDLEREHEQFRQLARRLRATSNGSLDLRKTLEGVLGDNGSSATGADRYRPADRLQ